MITLTDISLAFNKNQIFTHFNLSIQEGEFVCIVGTSGSGKTTILRLINGLLAPQQGSVTVNEHPLTKENIYKIRKKIGYVFQNHSLFPHMSVLKNLNFVLGLDNNKISAEKASELMAMVNLDDSYLNRYPNQLSGGQKQRVGIARALANNPPILLMDEPFSALDAITRVNLQQELKTLQKKLNKTVVFITHDMQEAFTLGSRIIILKEGQIVQDGTPNTIQTCPENEFVENLLKSSNLSIKKQESN